MTKPHSPHTPGPWRVNEDAAGITVVDSEGWIVAEGIGGFENERGTARLIAAAPELYAEAEENAALLQDILDHSNLSPASASRIAVALVNTNAALAKARGQQ
jgi:hypothetical protein